jgi:hypothetical protein
MSVAMWIEAAVDEIGIGALCGELGQCNSSGGGHRVLPLVDLCPQTQIYPMNHEGNLVTTQALMPDSAPSLYTTPWDTIDHIAQTIR